MLFILNERWELHECLVRTFQVAFLKVILEEKHSNPSPNLQQVVNYGHETRVSNMALRHLTHAEGSNWPLVLFLKP